MADPFLCPFCGFTSPEAWAVQLHVDEQHAEADSHVSRDDDQPERHDSAHSSSRPNSKSGVSSSNGNQWTRCTRRGCGEYVLFADVDEHLDLHTAEELSLQDLAPKPEIDLRHPRSLSEYRESRRAMEHSISPSEQSSQSSGSDRFPRSQPGSSKPSESYREPPRSPRRPDDHPEGCHTPTYVLRRSDKSSESTRSPLHDNRRRDHDRSLPHSPRKLQRPRELDRSPPRGQRNFDKRRSLPADVKSRESGISTWFSGSSSHGRPPRSRRPSPRRMPVPLNPGRLGERELGPYAFEPRMPDEVYRVLRFDARPQYENTIGRDGRLYREVYIPNETPGLIPVMADLFALDRDITATYLCHPGTKHVHKLRCEGNFCGYWSIQVILTYFQCLDPQRHTGTPTVLEMQEIIEAAWARDICPYGKVETGGVRNTRKWIGSHEALAFFTQIGVDVEALSFQKGDKGGEKIASQDLLDHVEAYFMSGMDTAEKHRTSYTTQLPPIYFQRFGHSMTIVGLERRYDGSRNLLVFDSSYATSRPMERLLDHGRSQSHPDDILRVYRRSDRSLSRWKEFEIIVPKIRDAQLSPSAQPSPSTKKPAEPSMRESGQRSPRDGRPDDSV